MEQLFSLMFLNGWFNAVISFACVIPFFINQLSIPFNRKLSRMNKISLLSINLFAFVGFLMVCHNSLNSYRFRLLTDNITQLASSEYISMIAMIFVSMAFLCIVVMWICFAINFANIVFSSAMFLTLIFFSTVGLSYVMMNNIHAKHWQEYVLFQVPLIESGKIAYQTNLNEFVPSNSMSVSIIDKKISTLADINIMKIVPFRTINIEKTSNLNSLSFF